jgi:biopolymer transport protein ExbD
MTRRRREAQSVSFDFAPMVDIVLLLVIFFMLTAQLFTSQRSLPVNLPTASNTVAAIPNIPTVSIDKAGQIALNGKIVSSEQLVIGLKPLLQRSGHTVALAADRNGAYGRVAAVLGLIRQAGGTRVALSTLTP